MSSEPSSPFQIDMGRVKINRSVCLTCDLRARARPLHPSRIRIDSSLALSMTPSAYDFVDLTWFDDRVEIVWDCLTWWIHKTRS